MSEENLQLDTEALHLSFSLLTATFPARPTALSGILTMKRSTFFTFETTVELTFHLSLKD